jgi:hypothetical protein
VDDLAIDKMPLVYKTFCLKMVAFKTKKILKKAFVWCFKHFSKLLFIFKFCKYE